MRSLLARLGLMILAATAIAYPQKPLIYPDGVVNAASYGTPPVAKGSIVAIFGENLAAGGQSADGFPLPTTLGGTSVTVKGVPAHIFYVSPSQINILFPSSLPLGPPEHPEIVVTTPSGASDPVAVATHHHFGIFTLDASGCGRAAVLNVGGDGSRSLNSPSASVSPGEFLEVYGTGLGAFYNAPPDGSPAPPDPLARSVAMPGAYLDLKHFVRTVYSGLAPGFVGLVQVNFQVPETVREACEVPLAINFEGRSQYVPISIRRGGGPCVDPPTESYGLITWERTMATGTNQDGLTEVLTAAFPAAPGLQAPEPWPPFQEGCWGDGEIFGPICPLPGYTNLDAGTVTLDGPGFGPIEAMPTAVDGLTVYRTALPPGTIQPGSFRLSAAGGRDLDPFESAVEIGQGINVTSSFPPGSKLPFGQFNVNWTGGDPESWVTAQLTGFAGPNLTKSFVCRVRASAGTVFFYVGTPGLPWPAPEYELVLEVTPDPADAPNLSIPGLSLGGQHAWKYTYRFGGLLTQ